VDVDAAAVAAVVVVVGAVSMEATVGPEAGVVVIGTGL